MTFITSLYHARGTNSGGEAPARMAAYRPQASTTLSLCRYTVRKTEGFNALYGPAEEVVRRRTVGVAAGLVVRQQITKGRRSWRAAWRMRIRECGCAWDGSLLRGPQRNITQPT